MKFIRPIGAVTKTIYYTKDLLQQFATLVGDNNQTYYPESTQKSRWSILRDNLWWMVKNQELNRFYYVYGLDIKDQQKARGVIGYRRFRSMRNAANLKPKGLNFNYACIMRDKFVFGQFLKSLGFSTPRNIALLDKKGVTWLHTMQRHSYDQFVQHAHSTVNGFCKKLRGIRGEGAFPLRIENGKLFSGDLEISISELSQKVDGTYLLQERLTQHADMARLHPESINTIRLVTFNNDGNVELFFAAVRMGTSGRNVDNWNAGGIAVAVDMATGRLRDYGIMKACYGKRAETHPDSNIMFSGYQIPFFKESVELVCNVHRYMYGMHSVGWDVAITEQGPTLIEANEDWDGSFAMCSEENFKEKFLRMFEK